MQPSSLPVSLGWSALTELKLAAVLQRLALWLRTDPHRMDLLITLQGDLGAGKTTFARHLLQALGIQEKIKSPTFTLVEPYELLLNGARVSIWHADLYRLEGGPQEWEDRGLEELLTGHGLRLVEWPERAGTALGQADIAVRISIAETDDLRNIEMSATTVRGCAALNALRDR